MEGRSDGIELGASDTLGFVGSAVIRMSFTFVGTSDGPRVGLLVLFFVGFCTGCVDGNVDGRSGARVLGFLLGRFVGFVFVLDIMCLIIICCIIIICILFLFLPFFAFSLMAPFPSSLVRLCVLLGVAILRRWCAE